MFTIDATSNSKYYVIKKDGVEFTKISKAKNSLEEIKKVYQIEIVE